MDKMNARQFCYWLQGAFELKNANGETEPFSEKQIELIQKILNSVFEHEIDQSYGDKEVQSVLNTIHNSDTKVRC